MQVKVPVSIRLNNQLLNRGRNFSKLQHKSFTQLVEDSLQEYIDKKIQTQKNHPLAKFAGTMTDEVADKMLADIKESKKQQLKLQKAKAEKLAKMFD